LQTKNVVKDFAAIEAQIQGSGVAISVSFMQQTEALALLNTQYSDGLIDKKSYDEQLKVSQSNFNKLTNSSFNLVKQLNKIDPSGQLANAAIKDLGDQALATLKKANPAMFDKITKAFEGISQSSQIRIYMGYADGSLTISDLAILPAILKEIDGKEAVVALKIISDSGLSGTGKADFSIPLQKKLIKDSKEKLKNLQNEKVSDKVRQAYRIQTAKDEVAYYEAVLKDLYKKKKATGVDPGVTFNTDFTPYQDLTDGTDSAKKATDRYLVVLQKEIDALKAKRDAQKDANDEIQREVDLKNKLQDLANQAVEAKISGNYLKAAMLTQESQNVQMKYNQETELRKKDAEIARLEARYKALEAGAPKTAAEIAKTPKFNAKTGLATGGPVKTYDSGGNVRGSGTATSDSIPAMLSNGEYVIKASSVAKYGTGTFDALNAQRFAFGSPGGVSPTPRPAKTNVPIGQIWGWEKQWQEANKQVVKIKVPPITSNFATNSFVLNKEQRLELQKIAKELTAAQVKAIIVQGHTDSVGSGKDNKILSQNRANAIAEYISKFVPGTGFVPVGYGEYKPLVPNTTAENRARNRRAELIMPDKYKTIYPEFQPQNHKWIINTGKIIGGGTIESKGMLVDSFKPTSKPTPKKTEAPKGIMTSGFANGGLIRSFHTGGFANYKLPSYAVGSTYIPQDQIAQLHKGERVLTAQENKNFTTSGPITNIININGTDLNKKEIATAVMVELDRVQKKNNKTNMVNK
jgi:outer membrane protein OmpA-like peptidoglycan-associated protein